MINEYSFGRIVIEKKEYTHDVIIIGPKIIEWWRDEGHHAKIQDFISIPNNTEILVIGTGESGVMKVDQTVLDHFKNKKIKVITEMTGNAVITFNKLIEENKKAVGAFHLTC